MGNKVILKRSSVAAKTPTTADLDYGELALNYNDGRLYYKTATNTIDYFSADVSGVVANSEFDIFSFTASTSQTIFTGADDNANTLSYAVGYIAVFINGVKISESDYTATNGTSVVLDTAVSAGELVEIISFKTVIWTTNTLSEFKTFKYIATASQTTFSGLDANSLTLDYQPNFITVFLNGVKLTADDYTATTGTSVVLDTGATVNDIIEIVSYKTLDLAFFEDYISTITGTSNQVIVGGTSGVGANVTLSLPQNIHTSATPTFAGVTMANGGVRSLTLTTSATTANQVLDSISATTFRSAKYQIQVTSSTSYHVTEVVVLHDGTDTFITEYGTITTASSLATFTADVSGGNLRLLTTPTNAVTTYKVIATAINA